MATTSTAPVEVNGPAIREIRTRLYLRQADLAREVGISGAYLSQLEHGHRTRVAGETFEALCSALRLTDRRAILAAPHAVDPAPVAGAAS